MSGLDRYSTRQLIQWLWQRHPMRGGVPQAIREVQKRWNDTLGSVG
jgi:hypothetical protein